MKTNDQRNEYFKSVVLPVDIMRRTVSGKDSHRTQTFEYFVRIQDKKINFPTLKQICKKAFIELNQITESRLRQKVFKNRDQTKDMRGHHQHRYQTIPLEVQTDIREFIENYPSRESHYTQTVRTGRKYLGPEKTMASLHREFIYNYQEYDNYVSYKFFSTTICVRSAQFLSQ
jgi:hypothetical protein